MASDDTRQDASNAPGARVRSSKEVHKRRISRADRRALKQPREAASEHVDDAPVVPTRFADVLAAQEGQGHDSANRGSEAPADDAQPGEEPVDEASDGIEGEAAGPVESEGAEEADPDEVEDGELSGESGKVEGAEGLPAASVADSSEGAGAPASGNEASRRDARVRPGTLIKVLVVLTLVAVVVMASLFAWNRWGRFDDRADIQGDWYVEGTAALVPIDSATIRLTDDVAYAYEIDEHDKTIRYTFGTWKGEGHYWFSDDRSILVIADGSYSGVQNTFDDLVQEFKDMAATSSGSVPELPEGDGIIVLSRTPDPVAFAEQEKARAEALSQARQMARDWGYDVDELSEDQLLELLQTGTIEGWDEDDAEGDGYDGAYAE